MADTFTWTLTGVHLYTERPEQFNHLAWPHYRSLKLDQD